MDWKSPKKSHLRSRLGAVAVAFSLAGCAGQSTDQGYISGFNGGVIADEPRAAVVGREVLATGGSAADAVVAAYFAMAVTLPGAAGLGGGGQCVIFSPTLERTESLLFPAETSVRGGTQVAVPANARGMFALHARYGLAAWADLLLPAERLAREGHPISRAFARRLQADGAALLQDPAARALFFDDAGQPIPEGRNVRQVELGALLSVLRTRGPGDLYGGQAGRQFAAATEHAGFPITVADLRRTRPQFQPTIQIPIGDELLHFAPTAGGAVAAQLWALLDRRGGFAGAAPVERAHMLAELGRLARRAADVGLAGIAGITDPGRLDTLLAEYDPAGTRVAADGLADAGTGGAAIVAADSFGEAVACAFTMNRPFGISRIAPGTGVLLAAPPPARNEAMAVAILANSTVNQLFFAGAAAAGPDGPLALVETAWPVLYGDSGLVDAVAAPRLGPDPVAPVVEVEEGITADVLEGLQQRGQQLRRTGRYGLVAALHCPGGLPRQTLCQFASDPRGFGLSSVTER